MGVGEHESHNSLGSNGAFTGFFELIRAQKPLLETVGYGVDKEIRHFLTNRTVLLRFLRNAELGLVYLLAVLLSTQ